MKRIFTFTLILFLIGVNLNFLKGIIEDNQKLATVNNQESSVGKLQQTNQGLKKQLGEVTSPFYVEKEARNRLDYGKNGEATIVLGENLNLAQNSSREVKSNPQKWLDLLRNQH